MVIKKIMSQDVEIKNLHLVHKQITISNLKKFDGFFLDALFHATEALIFISNSGKEISLNELQSLDSFMFENKEFSVRFDDESENMIQQIFEQSIKTQSQMTDFGIN
tara:strand:- start:101 stop:421 length:321 start_codon:yes stop_codon:yes gene_type:complete